MVVYLEPLRNVVLTMFFSARDLPVVSYTRWLLVHLLPCIKKTCTLNPKPKALNPKPKALNPKP